MASLTLPFLFEDSQGENTMKINIKECTIVRPQQETPKTRIWLSNLDLIRTSVHLTTMKFYHNSSGASNFFEPKLVKESLSKVLVEFHPVAGRLARDKNGRLEINCNGEGVLFVVAEMDAAMSDLGENFLPNQKHQLVPQLDYSSADITKFPLLLVQVTTFKCGGVSLVMGLNEILADGASATHFETSWASIARGQLVTLSPFFDRTVLCARSPPTSVFHHIEHNQPPMLNENHSQNRSDACMEVLEITPDQLSKLKDIARGPNGEYFSTYEVLTAHIWRCVSKARGLSNDQATKLRIPTDCRTRFDPQLPQGYFGNAVLGATPIALCGELKSESLRESVYRIRKAIKRMDNEYLRSSLDWLEQNKDFLTEQSCSNPNLSIVSLMRLPYYDTDFGWGIPIFMRPTSAYEGEVYILPKNPSGDDGKLLLFVCLERNHMKSFQKYFASVDCISARL